MRRRFFSVDKQSKFDYNNYLTIEALEDNVEIILPQPTIEYGIDGNGWKAYDGSIFLSSGQLLSLRNSVIYTYFGTIQINGKCNLLGNCMSLLYKDKAKYETSINNLLRELFMDCVGIQNVSANFLPATTLCTSCYQRMFYGCTSLVNAPELPATTLEYYCYQEMFYGCSKLDYIKMLATDISAPYCLAHWVNGVSPTGTFIKNPEATWEVYGDNGIPNGWKVVMDGEEDEVSLFKFYIADSPIWTKYIEYTAEEGMTWAEWVISEYNVGGIMLDSDYVVDSNGFALYNPNTGNSCKAYEVIIPETQYGI